MHGHNIAYSPYSRDTWFIQLLNYSSDHLIIIFRYVVKGVPSSKSDDPQPSTLAVNKLFSGGGHKTDEKKMFGLKETSSRRQPDSGLLGKAMSSKVCFTKPKSQCKVNKYHRFSTYFLWPLKSA